MSPPLRAAIVLSLGALWPAFGQVPATPEAAEPAAGETADWLFDSLSDSFAVGEAGTLRFRHPWGDVRVEGAATDRIHVTALAQLHRDDPRRPSIRFAPGAATHELVVEFAPDEGAADEAWKRRRIDVGLLVPAGLELELETGRGLIEVEKMTAASRLTSDRGDVVYDGAGSLAARTERGSLRALLRTTGDGRTAELSTLTGDIRCILLADARADVTLETRGPVTTDYSVAIDRAPGSPLKKGRIRIGENGTAITLTSHSGGIRLQGLLAPEVEAEGD
ncbi:MAG: hypothetical protein OEP45_14440 [Acidobacteriota bacterium]|nr:hypothetical protein [Acidobacteriota bacterium]